jgi:hypothetical protein
VGAVGTLTSDKHSNRSHLLWIADVDPLSIPAGGTPLLDCKPRDVWKAAAQGLDERGRRRTKRYGVAGILPIQHVPISRACSRPFHTSDDDCDLSGAVR